jgi:membrane protein YdbS with pleckstrin-like domain
MGKMSEKVIKPPIQKITSGKIFRPAKKYVYKEWVKQICIAFTLWLGIMVCFVGLTYFMGAVESREFPNPGNIVNLYWYQVHYWTSIFNLIWLIPALLLTPVYINSMEYSVKAESGETMPEIYVKKGIVTITRKHVPFRTITNIYSKAGPLDRLFGLGNVSIETAGFSGANQMGPEEKLEGVLFYEEVRDFILAELRNYREPYATGTEVSRSEEPVPRGPGLDDEILITLREIRDLLKN